MTLRPTASRARERLVQARVGVFQVPEATDPPLPRDLAVGRRGSKCRPPTARAQRYVRS
jgi:hypothetical protein